MRLISHFSVCFFFQDLNVNIDKIDIHLIVIDNQNIFLLNGSSDKERSDKTAVKVC